MAEDRWYTIKELVERWRVHEQTVRRWIKEGRLDAMMLGRKGGYRIRESEVERFERDHMGKAAA